jgi:hypothetical protein
MSADVPLLRLESRPGASRALGLAGQRGAAQERMGLSPREGLTAWFQAAVHGALMRGKMINEGRKVVVVVCVGRGGFDRRPRNGGVVDAD